VCALLTWISRPNHFISLKKMTGNSVVRDLYIYNYPVHCFYITGAQNLLLERIVLNNTLGDLPNAESEGKAAGHNTDGFGIASSDNVVLRDSQVWNQDDCVAITSGTNLTVYNMFCHGGHGLSIGSIGGKSSMPILASSSKSLQDSQYADNTVKNVIIRDSVLVNQDNGIRIKTNSGTTGVVQG
jgi:polygalacturonase